MKWVSEVPQPDSVRRGNKINAILAALKTRPGKWAQVSGPYKNNGSARQTAHLWRANGGFEFLPRTDESGAWFVYGRKIRNGRSS